jgi:hypothetical protein
MILPHLIDDGEEIDERFFAHRRIWGRGSKSEQRPIEPTVDRPVGQAPICNGMRGRTRQGVIL